MFTILTDAAANTSFTFANYLANMTFGSALAILGAFLAVGLAGWGSAKAVGMVGQVAAGVITEDPSVAGKAIILQALPATQGLYGFVVAFLVMLKGGALDGSIFTLDLQQGLFFFTACLPIAFVGFVSAIHQAKVAAAGVQMISKQKDKFGTALTSAVLVETYALFSLLVSALLVLLYK